MNVKPYFLFMFFALSLIFLFDNAYGALPGDVDGSGNIDLKDSIIALQININKIHSFIEPGADVNNDAKLGLIEAVFALQITAGIRELPDQSDLPDLIDYKFSIQETKILPGISTESAAATYCTGTIEEADTIGNLALAALLYQNACYTNGDYNNKNYKVEKGVVADSNNQIQFDSYRIYEPEHKATVFLASRHVVYYKFQTIEDYSVYIFDGNTFIKTLEIQASDISVDKFIKLDTLNASTISGFVTYVFVPSSQRVSTYTQVAEGIEGARIKSTAMGDIMKYRYSVSGTPFDNAVDYNIAPGNYTYPRQFFMVQKTGQTGIVWQNKEDNSIKLTWLGQDLKSSSTVGLANARNEILACVTYDESGFIYYMTIQSGSGADTETARTATLYKADDTGQELAKQNQDTSESGLDLIEFIPGADLKYLNGELGLILGRYMHGYPENHQGAIAVIFDADTLNVKSNLGQTSSHSWDCVLTTNSNNEFVGIDLGDNYPRGLSIHKFSGKTKVSRVVYTYKTIHQQYPGNSSEVFSEISSNQITFYKWSNDSYTYSELGGVTEGNDSYIITFTGEGKEGKTLDNSRVGSGINDPRNIAMVKVVSDFENTSGNGCIVSDDLILSSGITETGGYYTYYGSWVDQRNTGVVWLTDYTDRNLENATRLKTSRIGDNKILLLWEKWTLEKYVNTYAMLIDDSGSKLSGPVELGRYVRLNRRDDILVNGNNVYIISGDKNEKKLELIVFQIK